MSKIKDDMRIISSMSIAKCHLQGDSLKTTGDLSTEMLKTRNNR